MFNCNCSSMKLLIFVVTLILTIYLFSEPLIAQSQKIGSDSGLPIPRFVSLKSDRVNVRIGPKRVYDIAWTFVMAGLPVEIIEEFENWRRIRDWEGKEGWIFHSLLSGRRTALVKPWEETTTVPLRTNPDSTSNIIAELEPFVLAKISECKLNWCEVSGNDWEGWVEQSQLFGVYVDENIE